MQPPPEDVKGADDLNESLIAKMLKPVAKPTQCGLYRWSMEEDILLLKAVPLMGRMYAEISKRFISHRNRGALRKRYQVLERRVKGAMKRDKKSSNDIVRKSVAPLIEAISKKGPLPVFDVSNRSSNDQQGNPYRRPQLQNVGINRSNHKSKPTLPSSFPKVSKPNYLLPTVSKRSNQTGKKFGQRLPLNNQSQTVARNNLPSVPPMNNTLLQAVSNSNVTSMPSRANMGVILNAKLPISAPVPLESLSKQDTSSRLGFERIMNGEYSNMSAVKHFIEDSDARIQEALHSTNQVVHPVQLPHLNFDDNSCSGLSMLCSADLKAPNNMDKLIHASDRRRGTSIMSTILGRGNNLPSNPTSPMRPIRPIFSQQSMTSPTDINQLDQSMDGFSFSNLPRSIHLGDESKLGFNQEGDDAHLRTPGQYSGIQNAFSHFHAQASHIFHHPHNNSLMVPHTPQQHEVDAAAATLSQMSNSSTGFAAGFLSVPNTPDVKQSFIQTNNNTGTNATTKPISKQSSLSFFEKVKEKTKQK